MAARPGAGRTGLPGKSPRGAQEEPSCALLASTTSLEVVVDGPLRQPFAGALSPSLSLPSVAFKDEADYM